MSIVSTKSRKSPYAKSGNIRSVSYGSLSVFKNEILNKFVAENNVKKVVEIGCGDGNMLVNSKYSTYIGYDISEKAVTLCRSKINKDNYQFKVLDVEDIPESADLYLSLNGLPDQTNENKYKKYIYRLFTFSTQWVIIYRGYDNNKQVNYVRTIKREIKDWQLKQVIKNPENPSFGSFYVYMKKEVPMTFKTLQYKYYYHVYNILDIVSLCREKIVGNICKRHRDKNLNISDLHIKQENIYNISKKCTKILEIGFTLPG